MDRSASRGFTLVEMSLVLIIIGLTILIIFPALSAVRTNAQRTVTDSNLQTLLRATAAFVHANGCLPCPTPATTVGSAFGYVRGDNNTAACNGCGSPEGIPPFASLGLPMNMAKDGWGHWITMRVDPALTDNSFSSVIPNGMAGLCMTGLNKANQVIVQIPNGGSQPAAVIFVSHGPNGRGSLIASPQSGLKNGYRLLPLPCRVSTCTNSGGYECCNTDGNSTFINASPIVRNNDPFDDILLFLDRNALVSLIGNSVCQM